MQNIPLKRGDQGGETSKTKRPKETRKKEDRTGEEEDSLNRRDNFNWKSYGVIGNVVKVEGLGKEKGKTGRTGKELGIRSQKLFKGARRKTGDGTKRGKGRGRKRAHEKGRITIRDVSRNRTKSWASEGESP